MTPRQARSAAGKRVRSHRVLVLCYHAISEEWSPALAVTPDSFRRQVTSLVSRGWVGATFTDAVLDGPAKKTLAVTFDDAFSSVRELAAPVLAQLGLPATVFVPTDFPGREIMRWPEIDHWASSRFRHELAPMSWNDLRALASSGWEIGGHTCSHPHLPQLDAERLDRELIESRLVCERELSRPCRSVAYPFGEADDRVRAATAAAGYEVAAGLSPAAFVSPDLLDWPRVGVWHGEPAWRLRVKTSAVTMRLRSSEVVRQADVVRRRAGARVARVAERAGGRTAR